MKRTTLIFALLAFFSTFAFCAKPESDTPPPAKQILQAALKEAGATHRNVFLIFHASWCIWCRRLDTVLTKPEVKTLIGKNYVVVHLDVLERGDKKASLENPGGDEIMKKLGGETSGLPFYTFLDARGKKLADSNVMPGKTNNIGFPGSKEEIAAFGGLLKRTAEHLTDPQRLAILSAFSNR